MNPLVLQLSEKIKTEATVWKIIAVLQVVIGLATVIINISDGELEGGLYGGLIILIAVRNFKISGEDLKFSQEIIKCPVGIVTKYEPIFPLIVDLAYNIFVGGVIGVVACAFGFMTRSFVVNNKQAFLEIESAFNSTNNFNYSNQINYQNQ